MFGRKEGLKDVSSTDTACIAAQDKDASPHIAILRIQGPLCFANAARTKERILNLKVHFSSLFNCLHRILLLLAWKCRK